MEASICARLVVADLFILVFVLKPVTKIQSQKIDLVFREREREEVGSLNYLCKEKK